MKPFYFQCETKSVVDTEQGIKIVGYASTVDKDRVNDIVYPEAFNNSIAQFKEEGGAPALLRSHDPNRPAGRILMEGDDAPRNDGRGIIISALVTHDDTQKSVLNKEMIGLSIGYIVKSCFYTTEKTGKKNNDGQELELFIRHITDLDWLETSIVTMPANRKALFTLTKSLQSIPNFTGMHKCYMFPDEPVIGKIGDKYVSQKAVDMMEFKGEVEKLEEKPVDEKVEEPKQATTETVLAEEPKSEAEEAKPEGVVEVAEKAIQAETEEKQIADLMPLLSALVKKVKAVEEKNVKLEKELADIANQPVQKSKTFISYQSSPLVQDDKSAKQEKNIDSAFAELLMNARNNSAVGVDDDGE